MAKKYKKIWNSKEEHDAWEAHVDETLRRVRGLAERAWAEIQAKKAAAGDQPSAPPHTGGTAP